MSYHILKKQLYIFICLCFYSIVSLAQDHNFTIGIGAGISQCLADVTNKINFHHVYHADPDYHITNLFRQEQKFILPVVKLFILLVKRTVF